jgi:hypothetical protein
MSAIKVWCGSDDLILSNLCCRFINRNLYHVDISNTPHDKDFVAMLKENAVRKYGIDANDTEYFVFTDTIRNRAYNVGDGNIRILMKNGHVMDIAAASDNSNLEALAKTVKKNILCYTKELV